MSEIIQKYLDEFLTAFTKHELPIMCDVSVYSDCILRGQNTPLKHEEYVCDSVKVNFN